MHDSRAYFVFCQLRISTFTVTAGPSQIRNALCCNLHSAETAASAVRLLQALGQSVIENLLTGQSYTHATYGALLMLTNFQHGIFTLELANWAILL